MYMCVRAHVRVCVCVSRDGRQQMGPCCEIGGLVGWRRLELSQWLEESPRYWETASLAVARESTTAAPKQQPGQTVKHSSSNTQIS